MAFRAVSLRALRQDPRLLQLPPYLSAFCVVVGFAWLLLLPLNHYSRQTYVSENALLPGQVHTYFGGSEHNVFRAYRHEVAALAYRGPAEVAQGLGSILEGSGLKVARQRYNYPLAGRNVSGENVYGVLHGPRADATEAIVLVGPWANAEGELNQSGVALVLSLARYFKRWSLWSKDIIFLVTGDSIAGPKAWVDAYHNAHDPAVVQDLSLKCGALQAAVALDYPAGPGGHRFEKIHIIYDGVNGQLPNLDLFNTVVSIAANQLGMDVALQRMWKHDDTYRERLLTMLRGMLSQGLGRATGAHSAFIPYHVDAVTLQTIGDGWHDEMSLGRLVEGLFRSLNNLLEHLHQSFFFYLLMQANRFVSIGTYLPSAMLLAVNFTISCISLWHQSGSSTYLRHFPASFAHASAGAETASVKSSLGPRAGPVERRLFFPVLFVSSLHLLGLLPLYILNNSPPWSVATIFKALAVGSQVAPHITAVIISRAFQPSPQTYTLISCFSLLLLGMSLSALATLNFSLAFIIGLLTVPISFVRFRPYSRVLSLATSLVLAAVGPTTVVYLASHFGRVDISDILEQASAEWHISGMWTQLVLWFLWWPAWFCSASVAASSLYYPTTKVR